MSNKLIVKLRAPVLSQSGYGVHSRQIFDALSSDPRLEVCLENIPWGNCPFIADQEKLPQYYQAIAKFEAGKKQNAQWDISIHVSIPNEFKRDGKLTIGVTAGIEVDQCSPTWIQKINSEVDLVIVPSDFARQVMAGTIANWHDDKGNSGSIKIDKPIHVIPEWFERTEPAKIDLDFAASKNLLFVGQWGSKGGYGEDRKNIPNLVRIFYETFKDEPNVGLVLKINTVTNSIKDFQETKEKLKQIKANFPKARCKVELLHDTLTDAEMAALYTHPKIIGLVSLTHGEGYGLPLLEAAAYGLPVLATGWSGHLQFLREKHGFIPFEFSLKEIPECQVWQGVIEKHTKWAEVNPEDVQKKIRKFVNSPTIIRDAARKNVKYLDENFSREALLKSWQKLFSDLIGVEEIDEELDAATIYRAEKERQIAPLRKLVTESKNEKVLFVMPQSAGDILICTAIVDSLIQARHLTSDFYFATTDVFRPLLEGLQQKYGPDRFRIIPFEQSMISTEMTSEVWDVVYNPTINLQYQFSNWLLGNGDYACRLLEQIAKDCNLAPQEITDYCFYSQETPKPDGPYIVFGPGGQKGAKTYKYWDDVISNLKSFLPGVQIVQVGFQSEKLYNGCYDARGRSFNETLNLLEGAVLFVGCDSFPAHAAAATSTPHVVVYGSTSFNVQPIPLGKKTLGLLIETTNRHGCKNPCYKDSCANPKNGKNCISEISPEMICHQVLHAIEKLQGNENATAA